LNALVAADAVVVPLQCEYYALEGLTELLRTIERVRSAYNETLEIEGILLTMSDPRNNLSRQVEAEVREHFPELVFSTVIPRNVRLSESPSFGKPVLLHDIRSKGCQAYLKLAQEVLEGAS
jgi:chromosome partitioning protein